MNKFLRSFMPVLIRFGGRARILLVVFPAVAVVMIAACTSDSPTGNTSDINDNNSVTTSGTSASPESRPGPTLPKNKSIFWWYSDAGFNNKIGSTELCCSGGRVKHGCQGPECGAIRSVKWVIGCSEGQEWIRSCFKYNPNGPVTCPSHLPATPPVVECL